MHVMLVAGMAGMFLAGPALAEASFGSAVVKPPANPWAAKPASPARSWPALPASPKPAAASAPSLSPSSGFKPYEPYKGSSVYAAPKPASGGAKDCQLSVYVNACGKR